MNSDSRRKIKETALTNIILILVNKQTNQPTNTPSTPCALVSIRYSPSPQPQDYGELLLNSDVPTWAREQAASEMREARVNLQKLREEQRRREQQRRREEQCRRDEEEEEQRRREEEEAKARSRSRDHESECR